MMRRQEETAERRIRIFSAKYQIGARFASISALVYDFAEAVRAKISRLLAFSVMTRTHGYADRSNWHRK
jgi:hypothetical protein